MTINSEINTVRESQPKRIVAQVNVVALTSASGEPDFAIRYDVPSCLRAEMLQRLHSFVAQLEYRLGKDIEKALKNAPEPAK